MSNQNELNVLLLLLAIPSLLLGLSALVLAFFAFRKAGQAPKEIQGFDTYGNSLPEMRKVLEEMRDIERKMPERLDQAATRIITKWLGDNPEKILQNPETAAVLAKRVAEKFDYDDLPEKVTEAMSEAIVEFVKTFLADPASAFAERVRSEALACLEENIPGMLNSLMNNEDGWEDGYEKICTGVTDKAVALVKEEMDKPDSPLKAAFTAALTEHIKDNVSFTS